MFSSQFVSALPLTRFSSLPRKLSLDWPPGTPNSLRLNIRLPRGASVYTLIRSATVPSRPS